MHFLDCRRAVNSWRSVEDEDEAGGYATARRGAWRGSAACALTSRVTDTLLAAPPAVSETPT